MGRKVILVKNQRYFNNFPYKKKIILGGVGHGPPCPIATPPLNSTQYKPWIKWVIIRFFLQNQT